MSSVAISEVIVVAFIYGVLFLWLPWRLGRKAGYSRKWILCGMGAALIGAVVGPFSWHMGLAARKTGSLDLIGTAVGTISTLLLLVPIALFLVFFFGKWPIERQLELLRGMPDSNLTERHK